VIPGEARMDIIKLTGEISPQPEEHTIITIDGPAGAGKSTLAKMLSESLNFVFLDTGALYRVAALHLLKRGIRPEIDLVEVGDFETLDLRVKPGIASMRLFLGDDDVSEIIREESIGVCASKFSTNPHVRRALLELQRSFACRWNVVAEGRDMGTVVFPNAMVKFFLTADLNERAGRRYKELLDRGQIVDRAVVTSEMRSRDHRDELRKEAPLVPASDAVIIDTTGLSPVQALALMLVKIHNSAKKKS
jgi:CMP/dCMP kinase